MAKDEKTPVTRFVSAEDRLKALDNALLQIEKMYGKGAVMKLGDPSVGMAVECTPTGSLALDIALGTGGIRPWISQADAERSLRICINQ